MKIVDDTLTKFCLSPFVGFIDDSSSDLVCYIQADDVPGDRVVTPGFKAIMESAIDRYNITSE